MASGRREFLQDALKTCGLVAATSRIKAFQWLFGEAPDTLTLHNGWEFYESFDGSITFPIYGIMGGISTGWACYLIQKRAEQWFCIPVGFSYEEVANKDVLSLKNLVNKKLAKMTKKQGSPVDLNGGDLGVPDFGENNA